MIDPIGTHNEASVRRQGSGTRAILSVLVRTKEPIFLRELSGSVVEIALEFWHAAKAALAYAATRRVREIAVHDRIFIFNLVEDTVVRNQILNWAACDVVGIEFVIEGVQSKRDRWGLAQ